MLAHMSSESRRLGIGIPAELADELLGVRVEELVMIEALLPREGRPADAAHMRPLCGMHGHVLPQAGVGGESLVAHLAAEWPLARVAPDVDAQRLLVPAAVAAALAHEVLLLRVHLAVVAHVADGEEALAAARMRAGHVPFAGVLQLVALQLVTGFVAPTADLAGCSAVGLHHVLVQQAESRQLGLALQAGEGGGASSSLLAIVMVPL